MKTRAAAAALLLAAAPSYAQTIEVAPFAIVGYSTGAGIEKTAVGVQDLAIGGAMNWGAQAGYFFSDRFGVEVLWSRQATDLNVTSSTGSAPLFAMTMSRLHGNLVYRIGRRDGRLQPFVFGGLGSTSFSADDLQSETKLSWGAGGGVNWFVRRHVGVRAHAQLTPTHLDSSSSSYCNPFGFCQDSLVQFDFGTGVVLRF
jgi:outer membrane protein W